MANSILTPLMITRKALMVLHQQCNFIGNVNRQYDDKFANEGAKIGDSLNIRMPAKYVARKTATLAAQDHVSRSTPLNVTSQYGVDVSFTTAELTMSMDDFSERHLVPAMSQLASEIESACIQDAYKLVNSYTNATTDGKITYRRFQQGGTNMTKQLAPLGNRSAIMSPDSVLEFNDIVKGLFHSSTEITEQYKEGIMGKTGGFDIYENTLTPVHTTGTMAGSPVLDGANAGTTATTNVWASTTGLLVSGATATTTLKAGDIITIGSVFDCHPETKISTGKLKTFVVQSDITMTTATTTYTVTVKPALITGTGNAYKNASVSVSTDGLALSLIGAVNSAFNQDIQFHRDAFVFASAPLIDVSKLGAWGARDTMDGISMRLAKQYDITNDAVPTRIDVLFGFGGLYPELANRHMSEQDLY